MKMSVKDPAGDETLCKNPIYDSIQDDVDHLEQIICTHDTNFNSVTKEAWRDVVSPSSSISSINTSDSDDDDFSGYISIGDTNTSKDVKFVVSSSNTSSNHCDKSLEEAEDTLNESRVSLQEINMQIGIAEELILTPNSRLKNKQLFGNLETIHEGKFLHTPPKKAENSPRLNSQQLKTSTTTFVDRLVRE